MDCFRNKPPKPWITALFLLVFPIHQSALAAPFLFVTPAFQNWHSEQAPMTFHIETREDIRLLRIAISNNEGQVVYNRESFDLNAGRDRFRWDGVLSSGQKISTGRYQVRFRALFSAGGEESETVELRVIPAPKEKAVSGFAPPGVPYKAPHYRLGGDVQYFHRRDNNRGSITNEKRVTIRYSNRGEHYNADGTFAFLRRSPGLENLDNTRARFKYHWDAGSAEVVFRRSLGDFTDPLRLYADFRSENDKRGASFRQRTGLGEVRFLAFNGLPPAGGRQNGYGARLAGLIGDSFNYGLSATVLDARDRAGLVTRNNAGAVDLSYKLNRSQQISVESALTQGDSQLTGTVTGSGTGQRASWLYMGIQGMKLKLGYLALSKNYTASLSDPGNQVTSNVRGPEASVDYLYPGSVGWFSRWVVAAQAFDYHSQKGAPGINQINLSTQFKFLNAYRISLNARSRSERDQRTTTVTFSERHQWTQQWAGNFQYNRTKSPGSLTQRFVLRASTGQGGRYHRLNLEYLHRNGRQISNGPVDELGISASGRVNWWLYEATARGTSSKSEDGVNVFGRFAVEQKVLHRYVGQLYLALGERSAIDTTARIEVGAQLRF